MSETKPALPSGTNETASPEASEGWTFTRVVIVATGVFIAVISLLFVFAIILALTNPNDAGNIVEVIRDVVIIVLTLQCIFIVGALAILLLQIARFVNLLQNEVKPILKNAQETVNTAKTSVEFVGKNATGPVIRAGGFFAGLWAFLGEVTAIRRLIRRGKKE